MTVTVYTHKNFIDADVEDGQADEEVILMEEQAVIPDVDVQEAEVAESDPEVPEPVAVVPAEDTQSALDSDEMGDMGDEFSVPGVQQSSNLVKEMAADVLNNINLNSSINKVP